MTDNYSPPRRLLNLGPEDGVVLDEACGMFGLSRVELVRRLLKASLLLGPALSAENSQRVTELSHQTRLVGRSLNQIVKLIHQGGLPTIEETVGVWQALSSHVAMIDKELVGMTEAYGLKLRRTAELQVTARPGVLDG